MQQAVYQGVGLRVFRPERLPSLPRGGVQLDPAPLTAALVTAALELEPHRSLAHVLLVQRADPDRRRGVAHLMRYQEKRHALPLTRQRGSLAISGRSQQGGRRGIEPLPAETQLYNAFKAL